MPVQDIQGCDQELVGVLLLVAGQVTGVSPHQVQETEGDVRRTVARVELGKRRCGGGRRKQKVDECVGWVAQRFSVGKLTLKM